MLQNAVQLVSFSWSCIIIIAQGSVLVDSSLVPRPFVEKEPGTHHLICACVKVSVESSVKHPVNCSTCEPEIDFILKDMLQLQSSRDSCFNTLISLCHANHSTHYV